MVSMVMVNIVDNLNDFDLDCKNIFCIFVE